MELWVRSQNKQILRKVNELHIENYISGFQIISNSFILGSYETEERCLEILGEIQRSMEDLPIFVKDAGKLTKEDMEKALSLPIRPVCYNDNAVPLQTLVYQMPRE